MFKSFRIKSFSVMILTCAIGLALTVSQAEAGFQVTVRLGASSLTVVDNDGNDTNATVNTIEFTKTVGGFTFTGTFGSTNTNGTPTLSFVNSSVNNLEGTGPATFEVVVSASGFTVPISPPELEAKSAGTFLHRAITADGADGTYTMRGYLDQKNTLATDDLAVDADTFLISSKDTTKLTGPEATETVKDTRLVTNSVTPFSLTLVLGGTLEDSLTYSVDVDGTLSLRPTPAPAGLVLALIAAPVLGVGGLIRRKRKQVVA